MYVDKVCGLEVPLRGVSVVQADRSGYYGYYEFKILAGVNRNIAILSIFKALHDRYSPNRIELSLDPLTYKGVNIGVIVKFTN